MQLHRNLAPVLVACALAASAAGVGRAETPDAGGTGAATQESGEAPGESAAQPAEASGAGESTATEESAPAAAQKSSKPRGKIEEIVIQAAESEAAKDFEASDSVAAFDASDLEALGAQSIADLASFTPNLEIVSAGATTPTFFIRGVGLNDFGANSTSAVAIYRDDVPINAPALQLGTIFDVDGINVLRGPQGDGNARNASAGAIKLYSKLPTGNYSAQLRSALGNYNSQDFEGAIEAPIFEDLLSGRFSFRYLDRDGWMKNRCGDAPPISERGRNGLFDSKTKFDANGLPISICGETVDGQLFGDGYSDIAVGLPTHVNNRHNWAARGILLFQPTLDMEWTLKAYGERRDEDSRLGTSYGTNETTAIAGCEPFNNRAAGCRSRGTLGATDGEGYQAEEVAQMRIDANPCLNSDGSDNGMCSKVAAPGNPQDTEFRRAGEAAKQKVAEHLARNLDTKPFTGDFDKVGPTTNDIWGVTLKGDVVLGDSVNLTMVSSYDTYDRFISTDLDQTSNVLVEIDQDDEGWQFFQSAEFSGDFADRIPVRWTLGAYFLHEQIDVAITNFFPAGLLTAVGVLGRSYTQRIWSLAGYVGFEWDFLDDFTLDGGFRYNWEKKSIDYELQQGSQEPFTDYPTRIFQAPTGTIRLTYRFREDTHAYWKYTRGFKSGHFNATSSFAPYDEENTGVSVVDPETIDSFEAGLNGSWFTGRFNLNGALFHYNYSGYQIFTSQQKLGGQPEFVILNANNAEVYGAELDSVIRPWNGAFVQARFSWLESQFLDFVQKQDDIIPVGIANSIPVSIVIQNTGNRLLNSPQFKLSLTAEQEIPLGRFGSLTVRWDGAWTHDVNYDATASRGIPNFRGNQFLPEHTIGQRAYWLHNGRVAYRTPNGQVEIAGWVRNAFNQVYKTFAFDLSTFNKTTIYAIGDPRTYGISVTATF